MPKRVQPRDDARLNDQAMLLVRFNDDRAPDMALRNALRDATLYRALPGYERTGALTVSVFIVRDEREAQILTLGIGQELYGLSNVAALRSLGYEVVATDVYEEGVLVPFSDRHADVIVCAYPEDLPVYDAALRPAERRRIRSSLLADYTRALRVFDPRLPAPEDVR